MIDFGRIRSERIFRLDHSQRATSAANGRDNATLALFPCIFLLVGGGFKLSGCDWLLGRRDCLNCGRLRQDRLRDITYLEHVLFEKVIMRLTRRHSLLFIDCDRFLAVIGGFDRIVDTLTYDFKVSWSGSLRCWSD